jgi:hypothetical protein
MQATSYPATQTTKSFLIEKIQVLPEVQTVPLPGQSIDSELKQVVLEAVKAPPLPSCSVLQQLAPELNA